MSRASAEPVVFTGIGVMLPQASNIEAMLRSIESPPRQQSIADYQMQNFRAGEYLSDRKMQKSIAPRDVVGLAAVEECARNAKISKGLYAAETIGLYVGAAPSTCSDNENYLEAVAATRGADGAYNEGLFGKLCMGARPTTLLTGLPNNVLCYGSMVLDARGPNSNFTSAEVSGHLAIIAATRQLRRGRLRCAIAGGYTQNTDPVRTAMHQQNGWLRDESLKNAAGVYAVDPYTAAGQGTIFSDGAVFLGMEELASAKARGARIMGMLCGSALTSEPTTNPDAPRGDALAVAIRQALATAGVGAEQVGIVFTTGSGIGAIDAAELNAVASVFKAVENKPALATTGRVWGNLGEAGGLAELALLPTLSRQQQVPEYLRIADQSRVPSTKSHALLLRASMWGQYSCLVVKAN